jgi:hypothetical protein
VCLHFVFPFSSPCLEIQRGGDTTVNWERVDHDGERVACKTFFVIHEGAGETAVGEMHYTGGEIGGGRGRGDVERDEFLMEESLVLFRCNGISVVHSMSIPLSCCCYLCHHHAMLPL